VESSNREAEGLAGLGARRDDRSAIAMSHVDWQLADLLVLGALLALTAAFGKGFSTIGIASDSVYVTEVALVLTAGLTLLRLGPREIVVVLRNRVPLVPLTMFWVAGIVGIAQGIHEVGFTAMLEDVGLGEYSLLVPITVLVASSMRRVGLLTDALIWGAMAGTIVYTISDISTRFFDASGTFFDVQEITFGLYMSMLVAWVGAQLAGGQRVNRLQVAIAALALVEVFLTNARMVWVAIFVVVGVITLLTPRGERLRFGLRAIATVLCAFAIAFGIESAGGASQIATEVTGTIRGISPLTIETVAVGGAPGHGSAPGHEETITTQVGNTPESDNARWRLAYWKEMISRSVDNPIFGVGFGEPIAFTWSGIKYDFRDGNPGPGIDVDGPHNEYLHILYRMGYVGLLALFALIATTLWRVRRVLRLDELERSTRALLVSLVAIWSATATVALFSDALKGPFLGIFFWATIGLMLATAACAANEARGPASTASEPD
jgi:O-antigen ligase